MKKIDEISEKSSFKSRLANFWDKHDKDILSVIYTLVSVTIFLGIWEILSQTNVLPRPQIFAPSEIFVRLWALTKTGEIFIHILASMFRLLISFLIAAVCGILIGLLMGWKKIILDFLDPVITFFMPIPGIAWAPLFFLWVGFEPIFSRWGIIDQTSWWWSFGLANPILIIIGAIAGVFPIIQNISIAIQATDKKLVWAAQTMGADKRTVFYKVLIPSSFPHLFTGLKLGLARCWRTIIATEFMSAAAQGLGFFIFFSRSLATTRTLVNIYAGIFVLSVVFYLIELGIKGIEKQTIEKWGMVRKEGGTLG
jgi:ABC-type nitrate/sulfonate/bicarbonate transport system permease component